MRLTWTICEQIATMEWVRERTSIPVPKIVAYELDQSHPLGAHMLLEKARDLASLAFCPIDRTFLMDVGLWCTSGHNL